MCEKERCQYSYCLFCRYGTERRLSEAIERRHAHIRALAAVQEKHRYIDRRYEIDRQAFLPGYLFLYSKEEVEFGSIQRIGDVYRFLSGPMQHFAQNIVRLDMHTKNALVRMRFLDKEMRYVAGV